MTTRSSKANRQAFGRYLKQVRLSQGLSIRTLARRIKVHNTYLGFVERGERGTPTPYILERLARVLGVPLEVLAWASRGKRYTPWEMAITDQSLSASFTFDLHSGGPHASPPSTDQLVQLLRMLAPNSDILLSIPATGPVECGILEEF